jgi:hypothetical protein
MTVPDLPQCSFRTRFRPTTMTTHNNRWNFATVLAQSVLLFFLVCKRFSSRDPADPNAS